MGDIITNLDPAGVIATTSSWIAPLFNELLPIALVGLGIFIAGVFVSWLRESISDSIENVFQRRENKRLDREIATWSKEDREKYGL